MLAQGCCAEDVVLPVQAEQRGQAQDHPARGALGPTESWHAGLDHEEGAAHHGGTTCPIPQQCSDAQSCVPGSRRSLGHRLQTDIVPPKEDKGRWVPICREGRHENNPAGDVQSSTLPSMLSPGGQRQGRQGPVALQLLHTHRKGGPASWVGCDQDRLWLLHSGIPRAIRWHSALVLLVPGRTAVEQQTGRGEGAAQQAHASDMCCLWLRQTAGSGSLNVWKQHFSVSHFTKPQTITVCRCTGA